MVYPKTWDITPITLKSNKTNFEGLEEDDSTNINVRMEFGVSSKITKNSITMDSTGRFFKYGDLTINEGDEIVFDLITYKVIDVRKFRLDNGIVEYTRVYFQ